MLFSPLQKPRNLLYYEQGGEGARAGLPGLLLERWGGGLQVRRAMWTTRRRVAANTQSPCGASEGKSPPPGLPYLEGLGPGDEVGKVEVLDVVAGDHVGVHGADEGRPGLGVGAHRVTPVVILVTSMPWIFPTLGRFQKPPSAAGVLPPMVGRCF